MALLLTVFLLANAGRMFFSLNRGRGIPVSVYFSLIPHLLVQAATQMRWRGCQDKDAIRNWLRHFLLVTAYVTIFTLVALFLPVFQIEDSSFHWTSILGYYSTIVLLGATAWMLLDRIRKRSEMHRFSHLSDWLFPVLLFLTALTGILVHIFRLSNLAMATYTTYTVHLAIAVPMLVVEVPFGKWAHLAYRPLAIWAAAARTKALELPGREAAASAALAGNG
jgi:hypothetical protein